MSIGVIGDLAVGAHPGGADAWALAGVLATGVSAGAPPDEFNPRGQDWALSPWHPGRLAAAGYQPLGLRGKNRLMGCRGLVAAAGPGRRPRWRSTSSRELCDAWRSSGSEARRREAMAAYVVGERERFYRGRELHVPDH